MRVSSLRIIDESAFRAALKQARDGKDAPIVLLMRVLQIEFWLRNLDKHGLLMGHSAPALNPHALHAPGSILRSA
jgi:hypothetical protein